MLESLSTKRGVTTADSKYYAAGRPIALRVLPPGNNTGTLYFLHQDHPSAGILRMPLRASLGSTSVVTNLSGSVVARQWYYPYGVVRASVGTLPTDITFTGQRSDATGLYFYNARYYSPLIGRFISADTIVPEPGNPQDLNRFSYTRNNPIRYNDPSGHCPTCLGGFLLGAAFGAAVYGATTVASGRDFNWVDFGIATATGAIGGTLIGTGVGAGAGVAMFAAIGAGTGVLASEAGYALTAGTEYKSSEMLVAAGVGGVSGAITGVAGAPVGVNPISNVAVATGARLVTSAGAAVAQYAGTEIVKGRTPKWEVAGVQAMVGLATGGLDEKIGHSYAGAMIEKFGPGFVMKNMRIPFHKALGLDILTDIIRPATVEWLSDPLNDIASDEVDDLVPDR